MKAIILGIFSLASLSATAQTIPSTSAIPTGTKTPAKHVRPQAATAAPKQVWDHSLAAQIPFDKHVPYYDTAIKFARKINRKQLDANAAYYFEKEFGSKSIELLAHKHSYTGHGVYMFATDKKAGIPGIYKVYYTLNIKVKGQKCYVTMNDFKLENQHAQVSFEYLVKNAKENDSKSIKVLSLFEQFNQDELSKLMNSMSATEHNDYATASLR